MQGALKWPLILAAIALVWILVSLIAGGGIGSIIVASSRKRTAS